MQYGAQQIATHEDDIDLYEEQLLDAKKGFVIVRGMFPSAQLEAYHAECEHFLRRGRVIHLRMNRSDLYDYIHPRTLLADGKVVSSQSRTPSTYRIYEFPHNRHSRNPRDI
jgi:hypothetical protein